MFHGFRCPPSRYPAVGGFCHGDTGWPVLPPLPSYGTDRDIGAPARYQALIMAADADSIVIKGSGTRSLMPPLYCAMGNLYNIDLVYLIATVPGHA